MTGRPILVVLASGPHEFAGWCLDSGLSLDDPQVIYADHPRTLRGMTNAKVIRCRAWQSHPYADAINEDAQIIEQRSRPS